MTELRNLLHELSDQAMVYDVAQRAKDGGRRRRRRGRMMAGGGAALSIASVVIGLSVWHDAPPRPIPAYPASVSATPTKPAGPTVSCVAGELPQPPGYPRKAFVTGADPSGRFILGRAYPQGAGKRLLLWDGDTVNTVAMSGDDATLEDITTSGVAIGTSYLGDNPVSWTYRNGKTTRLAGDNATARALNESLIIVGVVGDWPVVWRNPSAQPEKLALPPGEWARGWAVAISDDGYIVGSVVAKVASGEGDTVGLLWRPDGTVERLAPPAGYSDTGGVGPTAIRGDWIIGRFMTSGRLVNVRWNRSTGGSVVFPAPVAWTVNALGSTGGVGEPALRLVSGEVIALPSNIDGYQGVNRGGIFQPDGVIAAISDDGHQVVGTLHDETFAGLAVRWSCR
ncbi:hypothetical protein Rhe02_77680 [Rhizocola hellebori]|uniref:Uncharacterized protein n=1 Tax=Rhizocola hellebori TaxID=1392758 RepID=A0A8J3VL68_9ACTN|nr:hypothetical protein [Rhizocola hellebori]GIH09701.1 hypothetical protein Rhe02_77680 [Rhizocola hellebori]